MNLSDDEIIDWYFNEMMEFVQNCEEKDKIKMIGECGLDFDRLEFADRDT